MDLHATNQIQYWQKKLNIMNDYHYMIFPLKI